MEAEIYQIINPTTQEPIVPVTHAEVTMYKESNVAEYLDGIPSKLNEAKNNANAYTDEKVSALAASLGVVSVISLAEYISLRKQGSTLPRFYAIYQDGELDKIYFDRSLFAKRANGEQKVTSCVFPVVFPIIFA